MARIKTWDNWLFVAESVTKRNRHTAAYCASRCGVSKIVFATGRVLFRGRKLFSVGGTELISANDNTKPVKLLRYCDLEETRGISYTRRHLYTLESERKFPRRVPIGENRVGWIESEIDGWIAERAASRAA